MKKYNVYIDGAEGTTGLRIRQRLADQADIALIDIPESLRKDPAARGQLINQSDLVFLCLPDEAAREAVALARPDVRIIDTSTAHRTHPDWRYGFPELGPDFRNHVINGHRISLPGCHASGFIALVRPLIEAGVLNPDAPLSCFSLTGYSGGGKKMIAAYQNSERAAAYAAPRPYALGQAHKHLPEMAAYAGLKTPPVFCPVVADFYNGMVISVPLHAGQLTRMLSARAVAEIYRDFYSEDAGLVRALPYTGENGILSANELADSDVMQVGVEGNNERFTLMARLDNLGKGACGAAIQCMNLMLGRPELAGLVV